METMAQNEAYPGILVRHRIPILITGIGLLIAIGLGIAPLLKSDPPQAEQVETPAAPAADPGLSVAAAADLDERLSRLEKSLSGRLDVIDLKLANLNTAVTRGHARTVALQNAQADFAESAAMVRSLEAHIAILNKAVPRLNARIRKLATDGPDDMNEMRRAVSALEAQMLTLNKAVPRLSERIRNLSANQQEARQVRNQIAEVSSALDELVQMLGE